jgi:AMMECR1 domain-containing protein
MYKRRRPSAALNSTSQLPENAIENMTQREKSLFLVCLKNGKSSLCLHINLYVEYSYSTNIFHGYSESNPGSGLAQKFKDVSK